MIIDAHTHVVSSDKAKHPLDPGARGWSTEVSNNVDDLIMEVDRAGVACVTLVQPNGTYGLDNSYQCDSANQYAPRTVAVGVLDPAAPDAADKLSYWVNEYGMKGVRLQSQANPMRSVVTRSGSVPNVLASRSPAVAAANPRRSTGCARWLLDTPTLSLPLITLPAGPATAVSGVVAYRSRRVRGQNAG
jgi:hypothetical protein